VHLAQLEYELTRMRGKGLVMSRLGAGVDMRGPGETKMEVDRRVVRKRIQTLRHRIDQMARTRRTQRARRLRAGVPLVALAGYTNAGKSTLLNALTDSSVLAEDFLFATLDPTSRRLRFPRDREVIITDTVGFIRDLPPDLVNAFRATLEELDDADLLLHVVDASDPRLDGQVEAVEGILADLGLAEKPRLLVLNKIDRLAPGEGQALAHARDGVAVSARTREGLPELLHRCDRLLWADGKVSFADVAAGAPAPPQEPLQAPPPVPLRRGA
jgi:GTP-binding protein HflX